MLPSAALLTDDDDDVGDVDADDANDVVVPQPHHHQLYPL